MSELPQDEFDSAQMARAGDPAQVDLAKDGARSRLRQVLFGVQELPPKIGRFVFLRHLGAGGMGVVVAAYDPKLRREVAIKVVRRFTDPKAQRRLVREAQAMARVKHPNVISVYEIGDIDAGVFIAMELVDGVSLRRWLARGRETGEVLDVLEQAGRGLAAAHAAGLVHCDFKPDNCLVDERGQVRVVDFGVARALGTQPTAETGACRDWGSESAETATAARGGTWRYMAPEQAARGVVDDKTDQFSFAVTAFEALTGRHPFASGTKGYDPRSIQTPPTFPDRSVPPFVRHTLTRALSLDPAERFHSLGHLLSQLRRTPSRRRRTATMAAGLAVLAGAGGLAYFGATRGPPLCDADALVDSWSSEHRARLEAAWQEAPVGYAADTWTRLASNLDAYAEGLARRGRDVCEGPRPEGPDALHLRTLTYACLEERARHLDATLEILETVDADVARRGPEIVATLPILGGCDDPQTLVRREVAPLADDDRRRAEEIVAELARVTATIAAGKLDDAAGAAEGALRDARDLAHGPTLAEALLTVANVQGRRREIDVQATTLREAFAVAYEAGDQTSVAHAAVALIKNVGYHRAEAETAAPWIDVAEAAIERGADERRTRLLLADARGSLEFAAGRPEAALPHMKQALELAKGLYGEDDPRTLDTLENVVVATAAAGDLETARTEQSRVIELTAAQRGTRHPEYGYALANAGAMAGQARDPEAALDLLQRAHAIIAEALGDDHPDLDGLQLSIATALRKSGRPREALPYAERAWTCRRARLGPDHPGTGQAAYTLGRALMELDRPDPARERMQEAVRIFAAKLPPDHPDRRSAERRLADLEAG